MRRLYGVAMHSMVNVYDRIGPWCKKNDIKIKIVDQIDRNLSKKEIKKKFKSDLLMVPDFPTFNWLSPILPKLDNIVLLFDSPLYLNEINGLQFLDIDNNNNLSYSFIIQKFDEDKLKKKLKSLKNDKLTKHNYDLKHQTRIIPKMIEIEQQTKFLGHYNNFIQHTTNHNNNTTVKQLILGYMLGTLSRKKYDKMISKHVPKKGLGKKYYDNMVNFLDSDNGQKLMEALQEIQQIKSQIDNNERKTKTIPYTKIAQQYNVDRYELKYINKLYRSVSSIRTNKRTIEDIADAFKKNRESMTQ